MIVSPAQPAEPINMPFGLSLLYGGLEPLAKGQFWRVKTTWAPVSHT